MCERNQMGVCGFIPFYYKDAFCMSRWLLLYSSGKVEGDRVVFCQLLVQGYSGVGGCSVPRAEAVFCGTRGRVLAQDYKYGKFYRLLNKDNLLCLKNKANQHPPNEQSRGVRL